MIAACSSRLPTHINARSRRVVPAPLLQFVAPRICVYGRQPVEHGRARSISQACGAASHDGIAPEPPTIQIALVDEADRVPGDVATVSLKSNPWAWRRQHLAAIATFCGPALAIPLADPLMSLVDNICVGRFSGTMELAALAPCTLIFSLGYIFNALSVATLSSVAEGIQDGDGDRAQRALCAALFVAFVLGLGVWALLQTQAVALVRFTGCAPELVAPAIAYLKIRAIAAPAVLVTMCAQAGLLAQKDAVTPLLVVLFSASVNLLGDFFLITRYGMGIRGAAWATAFSQILGAIMLLHVLQNVSKVKPTLRLPTIDDLQLLASTLGAMTLVYLAKNLTYIQIQLTATVLPPLTLAAHQLLYSLWSLTSFVTVPLEQASLTFLPSARGHLEAVELAKLIVVIGTVAGIMGGLVAAGLPLAIPQAFTHDVALHPIMRSVLPQVFLAMLLCGLDVSATGLLVAKKDLRFVVRAMFLTFFVSFAALFAVRALGLGLPGVWWGLCVFFASRGLQSFPRLLSIFSRQPGHHHVSDNRPVPAT